MTDGKKYSIAFVDVGGTLLKPAESIGTTYCRYLQDYGISAVVQDIDERFYTLFRELKEASRSCGGTAYGQTLESARLFWKKVFLGCYDVRQM